MSSQVPSYDQYQNNSQQPQQPVYQQQFNNNNAQFQQQVSHSQIL